MKTILLTAILAAGVLALGTAQASPELSKSAGCAKCHDLEKKKKGPRTRRAPPSTRARPTRRRRSSRAITDPKGDHPEMKASADDTKTMIKWILTQ
jgi:cytochrome c